MYIKERLARMPPGLVIWLLASLFPLAVTALENDVVPDINEYQLGTGDKIRIQVYNEADLYLEARVNDSGIISYPFLGTLKVRGLTPVQIEDVITSRLKGDYLVNPKVSVDIIEYRQFYVNGEVQAPGGFPFQPGITVRKAISVAGGFKERASKEKIFIIREGSPDKKPAKVNLDDKVRPGDIITVEESFF
jgi:polysaccharide biosynthesis/export protein VpsN